MSCIGKEKAYQSFDSQEFLLEKEDALTLTFWGRMYEGIFHRLFYVRPTALA